MVGILQIPSWAERHEGRLDTRRCVIKNSIDSLEIIVPYGTEHESKKNIDRLI